MTDRETDAPPTLPENELPSLPPPADPIDIAAVVVRNIVEDVVRAELKDTKQHVTNSADAVLTAIHEFGGKLDALLENDTAQRTDIDRILDHLGMSRGPINGSGSHV